jgi:hypothetical protein
MTEEQQPEQEQEQEQTTAIIQLGDIIQLIAPKEEIIHNKIFLVKYIDNSFIKLTSDIDYTIRLNDDGTLSNDLIIGINILSRDENQGYARQNGLLVNTWIDIFFNGDLPTTITGKITNLEEDMIEIKTYPDNDIIYLDFAYKGLPAELPIESITIRSPPEDIQVEEMETEQQLEQAQAHATPSGIQFEDENEAIYEDEKQVEAIPVKQIQKQIKEIILNANQIQLGDELDGIIQVVDVPENEQRFGIDKQTNDLLDEMLSSIPNAQRNTTVLNNIHQMIERFKQLRAEFSKFDQYGNADMPDIQGANYKPLVKSLSELNQKLYWILPVCKTKKKIYDADVDAQDEYDDIVPLTMAQSRIAEAEAINLYKSNEVPDGQNKYNYLINKQDALATPFEYPTYQDDSVMITKQVNDNLNAIIDNLGELNSSIFKNNGINRRKFIIQTYNLGQSRLNATENQAKKTFLKRVKLTPNDNIAIKSFITLPEPTVRYSHINLPRTNVLEKSNLNMHHLNYWQLLRKNTIVNNQIIDDLTKDSPLEEKTFLNDIKQYILSETINDPDKYEKYINTIVPKTRILFNLVKKYIVGKVSLYEITKYLEPFLIYHKDLSFKQYETILLFINDKIRDFKKQYVEQSRDFRKVYDSIKRHTNFISPSLSDTYFTGKNVKNYKRYLSDFYDDIELKVNMNTIEGLNFMNQYDYGQALTVTVACSCLSLMVPSTIEDLNTKLEEVNTMKKEDNETNQCSKYVLAKKYIEIDELNEDNKKDIYFDKQYDTTRYEIIKEYSHEKDNLEPAQFLQFLSEKLMETVGLNKANALRDAKSMILGKRLVEDGDYAILEVDYELLANERPKTVYFIREQNAWVHDDTIDNSIFTDKNKVFCNIQPNCFDVKNTCNDTRVAQNKLNEQNIKAVINEFESQYPKDKSVLEAMIKKLFDYRLDQEDAIKALHSKYKYQYNDIQFKIGETAGEVISKSSPHAKLRDLILGITDFVKKQNNIQKFVNTYTREAYETEDKYWRYCIDTDIKLLPTFLDTLSSAFISGENYFEALEKVCSEQGTISDDGDSWVDKHSGYIIRKVEFDVEEGYDEQGFKVVTRQLLDADIGLKVLQPTDASKKEFDSPEATLVSTILNAMTSFMGINVLEQRDFIIKNAVATQIGSMPSKADYATLEESLVAKGKKIPSYEETYNATIIYITLSYLLIGILVSMPSIKTKKTFPNCIKSFTGYPLTGVEDKTGLVYISCVANKIKSSSKPWNAIQKTSQVTIAKKIEKILEDHILTNADVQTKLAEKREYLAKHIEEAIPEEHDITNWINFLPPLKPVQLVPTNISADFKKSLEENVSKGNKHQNEQIEVLQGKVIYYSIAIQSLIQKIVSKEVPILKTASLEPYLENSCCNQGQTNTHDYFNSREPNIEGYNGIATVLSNYIDDIKNISKAAYLIDPYNYKFKFPEIENSFSEKDIYRAFMLFCRFNNNLPISDSLRRVCLEKPEDFNPDDTFDDKVKFLKRNGKKYSQESFEQLMDIINNENRVTVNMDEAEVSYSQILRELVKYKIDNDTNNDIVLKKSNKNKENQPTQAKNKTFEMMLNDLLDTYNLSATQDTEEMRTLKNYLAKQNELMQTELFDFLNKHSNLNKNNMQKIKDIVKNIATFNLNRNDIIRDPEDATMYKSIEFIKKTLRNMVDVFPNIILNKADYTSINVPKHWKLSQKHTLDIKTIVSKHYSNLTGFYEDPDVANLLTKVKSSCNETYEMALNTPFLSTILRGGEQIHSLFDRRMSLLLFNYYTLTIFKQYIKLSDLTEPTLVTIPKFIQTLPTTSTSIEVQSAANGEINEVEILSGDRLKLSQKIASILINYVEMIGNDKKIIDYTYEKIMEDVLKIKEKEKDSITGFFEKITEDEREIENIFKNNKLERWNVGLQKGLTQYVGKTYDQEREKMEKRIRDDIRLGKNMEVNDMNAEIYALDLEARDAMDAELDKEANDISQLAEFDDFGEREDREDVEGYQYDLNSMTYND